MELSKVFVQKSRQKTAVCTVPAPLEPPPAGPPSGPQEVARMPAEPLARLAAIVPPPRVHSVRYFGAFSSHARLRSRVVPQPQHEAAVECAHPAGKETADASPASRRRRGWAQLMATVFGLDVLECPRCGQKGMQRLAFITQPSVIRSILASVGLATAPPAGPPNVMAGGQDDPSSHDAADPMPPADWS